MKYHLLFIMLFFSVFGFSQKSRLDLKSIEKNLKDSKSPYNYDRLIFKYKGLPKSLDSIEAQHLYYGRNFDKNKISTTDAEFKSVADAFKNQNFEDCIRQGRILYGKDPTNPDVLLILLRAYDYKKDGNNFTHHLGQLRVLTDAIKSSGDGKTEKTPYIVNSVGDEYILLNLLNIGQDYSRSSQAVKDGMIDLWEKDNNKIYVKILYLDL